MFDWSSIRSWTAKISVSRWSNRGIDCFSSSSDASRCFNNDEESRPRFSFRTIILAKNDPQIHRSNACLCDFAVDGSTTQHRVNRSAACRCSRDWHGGVERCHELLFVCCSRSITLVLFDDAGEDTSPGRSVWSTRPCSTFVLLAWQCHSTIHCLFTRIHLCIAILRKTRRSQDRFSFSEHRSTIAWARRRSVRHGNSEWSDPSVGHDHHHHWPLQISLTLSVLPRLLKQCPLETTQVKGNDTRYGAVYYSWRWRSGANTSVYDTNVPRNTTVLSCKSMAGNTAVFSRIRKRCIVRSSNTVVSQNDRD